MNFNSLPIKCDLIHDFFNFPMRIASGRRDAYLSDGAWFSAAGPPGNHTYLYIAIRNLLVQKKMFTKVDFKNNICVRTEHVFLKQ